MLFYNFKESYVIIITRERASSEKKDAVQRTKKPPACLSPLNDGRYYRERRIIAEQTATTDDARGLLGKSSFLLFVMRI
jgi:hypothetical protein